MKRIFSFGTIFVASALIITACQKTDYNPSMAATINNLPIKATGKSRVTAHVDTTTHNPQLVIITGTSDTYTPGTSYMPVIELVVPHFIGTHVINSIYDSTKRAMVFNQGSGTTGSPAVSGEIKILNIKDGKIQGNFTLTCADGTTVTNGQYIAEESYY